MSQNKISFFVEEITFRIRNKKLLRNWLSNSIASENKRVGELNIILCHDDYLYKMNLEYLNHDTLTDIITFDYSETNTISGELFISITRVKVNAKIYSKTIVDELHRVIIHGILHLCGFGDKTIPEKEIMTTKENFYLSQRPDKLVYA
jgi:rRNA maturation RNase YbeY